ncbi:hypothetical protein K1719_015558 [Acacia pycnantha]|nr:hypothetical protein K1719_015558 [Acacia pycnantha]
MESMTTHSLLHEVLYGISMQQEIIAMKFSKLKHETPEITCIFVKASGTKIKRVLFCRTENGRSSFFRQLKPDWHFDTNPEVITQLAVMEQLVNRLDVAMFNVILRESDEEMPTDPISDPITYSRVLPIPT